MKGTTIEDRLELHWEPTWDPQFPFEVTATEQLSSKRATTVRYLVSEDEPKHGRRVFLVAKSPDQPGVARAAEVYAVETDGRGLERCSCKGSVCRYQAAPCRHRLILRFLTQQAVM